MTATREQLDYLSLKLARHGVSAFCPTTYSASPGDLYDAVLHIGTWIKYHKKGAKPLGIHLEGPFINPSAHGAQQTRHIRKLDLEELEGLWIASQKTLKLITVAPEPDVVPPKYLKRLCTWARKRGIALSMGHSLATMQEATTAIKAGFRGVTHAWNAMAFHHREPGILGAALGTPGVFTELIIDGSHVSLPLIRWMLFLNSSRTCFVSDCVPAAGCPAGEKHLFAGKNIAFRTGACRTDDGSLAGGGLLLPDAYRRWVHLEARRTGLGKREIIKHTIKCATKTPLSFLANA